MENFTAPSSGGKTLRPCLAELLRTCVYPPRLLLKVEHVFRPAESDRNGRSTMPTSNQTQPSGDHDNLDVELRQSTPQSLRLALSDGQLQIQAVLATKLHTKELLELRKGDLLELKKFQVRRAPRVNGNGKVVYLGVDACEWVGSVTQEADEDLGGGFIPEVDYDHLLEKDSFPSTRTFLGRTAETTRGRNEGEAIPTAKQSSETRIETTTPLHKMDRKRSRDPPIHQSNLSSRKTLFSEQPSSRSRSTTRPTVRFATPNPDSDDSSDDDDFETIVTSPSTIQRRRETLRNTGLTTPSRVVPASTLSHYAGASNDEGLLDDKFTKSQSPTTATATEALHSDAELPSSTIPPQEYDDAGNASSSLAATTSPLRITTQHLQPTARSQVPNPLPSNAPLQTLSTLLHSSALPRRNYVCSVLGIITWTSPSLIHKPNSPFPPKRHIKIHDTSILSRRVGVTVAIFVDAKNFMPEIGTVALFRGVTMQKWEGEPILNAYANLKECGEEWFITADETLKAMGHDVIGMKRWWAELAGRKAPSSMK
ncbi:hypothetical protein LTR84_004850 [Exophiala bonariae]|uniref:Telomeric single stranded DNA binding POT1/Cdc13 domain-containing protein n=1 Tax=Exophiala bonariae TaxID=1690606 RepID=A0AAV9NS38_9EURO|nr:hypothetical protein LTR84_004850 [Exophiala bonariae]